jgi:hypothetical protein
VLPHRRAAGGEVPDADTKLDAIGSAPAAPAGEVVGLLGSGSEVVSPAAASEMAEAIIFDKKKISRSAPSSRASTDSRLVFGTRPSSRRRRGEGDRVDMTTREGRPGRTAASVRKTFAEVDKMLGCGAGPLRPGRAGQALAASPGLGRDAALL